MKLSVSTQLSASASPACNGRKTYHKEVNLKFLFERSIYKALGKPCFKWINIL